MGNEVQDIIERVKALREIEQISSETLAKELGFDPAEYQKWEDGTKDFPVGALVEIAFRFKIDLAALVSGESPKLKVYCLTRAGEGHKVTRRAAFNYWNLAYNFDRKKGEPFLVEIKAESENEPLTTSSHPGHEFNYVLEGRMIISVGGHEMEMGPGDSIYYNSGEYHGMKSIGGKNTRFLAIIF